MDNIVRTYLYGALIVAILFVILSSNFLYWITNGVSTTLFGPRLFDYYRGGPTLSGIFIHAVIFFAIVFGVIDYIYSSLNGDDDSDVVV